MQNLKPERLSRRFRTSRLLICCALLVCLWGLYGACGCGSEKTKEPEPGATGEERGDEPDEDQPLRISLAEATRLAAQGDRRAVEPLLHAVENADIVADRLVAVLHLGKLKASSAVPILVAELKRLIEFKALDDTRRLYRGKLVWALEEITGICHEPGSDPAESIRLWTHWYERHRSRPPR